MGTLTSENIYDQIYFLRGLAPASGISLIALMPVFHRSFLARCLCSLLGVAIACFASFLNYQSVCDATNDSPFCQPFSLPGYLAFSGLNINHCVIINCLLIIALVQCLYLGQLITYIRERIPIKEFFDSVFSAVILAPICEEIIFRSSTIPYLIEGLGMTPRAALISSSLLFGLAHGSRFVKTFVQLGMQFTWKKGLISVISTFAFTFPFGVVAGAIYINTRSVYPAIIAHSMANLYGLPILGQWVKLGPVSASVAFFCFATALLICADMIRHAFSSSFSSPSCAYLKNILP